MLLSGVASVGALIVLGLLFVRPQLGIIALAAFFSLNLYVIRLPLPGLNFETVFIAIAIGLTLLRFGFRIPPLRFSGPIVAYIGVLFVGFLVTTSWAPREIAQFSSFGLFKVAKSQVFTALLFFPTYLWFSNASDRRRLLEGMSLGLALAACATLADAALQITESARMGRPAGLLSDPNAMAQCLAAFSLIQLHLFSSLELSPIRRWLHLGLYTLVLLAVALSLSRSAWLALVLGHGIYLMYVNRKLLLAGAATLVLAVTIGFPFLPGLVRDRVEETFRSGNVVFAGNSRLESSAASRVVFYRIGAGMFLDSPVWGHGLASFKLLTPKYGARFGMLHHKDPHSLPLKLGAEMGTLGLGVFLWLSFMVLQTGRRLWRARSDERGFGPLLLGAGATLLIANLFTTEFMHTHQVSAYFWLLLAIAAHSDQDRASESL